MQPGDDNGNLDESAHMYDITCRKASKAQTRYQYMHGREVTNMTKALLMFNRWVIDCTSYVGGGTQNPNMEKVPGIWRRYREYGEGTGNMENTCMSCMSSFLID